MSKLHSVRYRNIFLGSKITADGDCSHEIKRHLLIGRKGMTILDSILKSRDITFLTKVYLVKIMVFPVVMYGCEKWTIKKSEHQRIDAFEHALELPSKEEMSFNFMAAVTICSDFGAPKNKAQAL